MKSLSKKKKHSGGLNKDISNELLLLTIPGIAWFFIFSYLPMGGLVLAFKNFKYRDGIFGSPWVGFDNFKFFFKSNSAARIITNTMGYNIAFLLFNLAVAVTFAILLSSVGKKVLKVGQTSFLLPYFMSWVVVGYIALTLFDNESGMLNSIITSMGGNPISWYETQGPWRIILVLANGWKTVGQTTLVFYGSILGIGSEIYEAAELDGCTGLKKVFKITLPLLKPAIITMLILNIGSIMRGDFGLFYYMTNDSKILYPVTDVIDTYVYRALRVNGDISSSSAVSFFQSVVGFIMVVTTNYIVKKVEPGSEMF